MDIFISYRLAERDRVRALIYEPLLRKGLKDHIYFSVETMHREHPAAGGLHQEMVDRLEAAKILVVAGSRLLFDRSVLNYCHNEINHIRRRRSKEEVTVLVGLMDTHSTENYFTGSASFFPLNDDHHFDVFDTSQAEVMSRVIHDEWLRRLPDVDRLGRDWCRSMQQDRLDALGLQAPAALSFVDGTPAGRFALLPALTYQAAGRSIVQSEDVLVAVEPTEIGRSRREISQTMIGQPLFDAAKRFVGLVRFPSTQETRLSTPFVACWDPATWVQGLMVDDPDEHRYACVLDTTTGTIMRKIDAASHPLWGVRLSCTVQRPPV